MCHNSKTNTSTVLHCNAKNFGTWLKDTNPFTGDTSCDHPHSTLRFLDICAPKRTWNELHHQRSITTKDSIEIDRKFYVINEEIGRFALPKGVQCLYFRLALSRKKAVSRNAFPAFNLLLHPKPSNSKTTTTLLLIPHELFTDTATTRQYFQFFPEKRLDLTSRRVAVICPTTAWKGRTITYFTLATD